MLSFQSGKKCIEIFVFFGGKSSVQKLFSTRDYILQEIKN